MNILLRPMASIAISLAVLISPTVAVAQIKAEISGPTEAVAGQKVTYKIHISTIENTENESVLFYYVPPKELSFSSVSSNNTELMQANYNESYNQVYAEGFDWENGAEVTLSISAYVKEPLKGKKAVSYFSFMVNDSDHEGEYSQRKVITLSNK